MQKCVPFSSWIQREQRTLEFLWSTRPFYWLSNTKKKRFNDTFNPVRVEECPEDFEVVFFFIILHYIHKQRPAMYQIKFLSLLVSFSRKIRFIRNKKFLAYTVQCYAKKNSRLVLSLWSIFFLLKKNPSLRLPSGQRCNKISTETVHYRCNAM